MLFVLLMTPLPPCLTLTETLFPYTTPSDLWDGRKVVLTFVLLAPSNGSETMIEALPAAVAEVPDLLYVVLGATHPNLVAHEGEAYRDRLKALAHDLGDRKSVV